MIPHSLRKLLNAPGFTIAAAVTLAVGIGANTTIFTIVNAVLLRPPVHVVAPERLVSLFTSDYSGPPFGSSSYPDYEQFRDARDVFESAMAFQPGVISIGDGDDMIRTGIERVSSSYFQVLGIRPEVGHLFADGDDADRGSAIAIISDDLWRRRFAADLNVIGQTIRLGGTTFAIGGVAPAGFSGALRGPTMDVWISVNFPAALGFFDPSDRTGRGNRSWFVTARLKRGVTIDAAQARMAVLARQLHASFPEAWTDVTKQGRRITLVSERNARIPPMVRGPALGFVGILSGTVALVLLVCCANVAGLLVARASGRTREIAIRLALGASRGAIVRQLLAESIWLALLGGTLGVMLAVWATHAIAAFEPPLPLKIALDLSLDVRVLAFSAIATLGTGIVFGLAPALRASRPQLVPALKSESVAIPLGSRRVPLMSALVVSQVAISMLLLAGAMLFIRSLQSAAHIDPGFRAERMLLVHLEPRPGTERTADRSGVARELVQRVGGLAAVREVSWSGDVPLGFGGSRRGIVVEGYSPRDGEDMEYHYNNVGPGYFETMQIPLLRGRGFTDADRTGAPLVIVVNEAFARRFWGNENPIGKRISISGKSGPFAEVVGVTVTGKYLSLGESARPYIYLPALQVPDAVTLHVRVSGEPRALLAAVRRELAAVAPGWQMQDVRTMDEQIAGSLLPQRVAGTMLSLFGAVALLLAATGLYGVIAYGVARRSREIGVRVALGAQRSDVLGLVLRQSLGLVGLGLAIGVPAAWGVSRLLGSFLVGTSAGDPLSYAVAATMLASVSLLASWIPARRAMGVDPVVALRIE